MSALLVPLLGLILTSAVVGGSVLTTRRVEQREARLEADASQASAAEEAAQREQARAVADAESVRLRQTNRIDRFGLVNFLQGLRLRHPWAHRAEAINSERDNTDAEVAESLVKKESAAAELADSPIGSNRAFAIGAFVLWVSMSALLLLLDFELLGSQQQSREVRVALAGSLTLTIEAIGVVIWSALGVHTIPLLASRRKEARIATGMLAAVAVATLLTLVILPLAASRADEVDGERVRSAASVLAATQVDGDPSGIAAATLVLEEAQAGYDRTVIMNQGFAVGLTLGVIAFSWAPFALADHRRLRRAERRHDDAVARRRQVDAAQGQFDADFIDHAATILDELDLNPNDVRLLLTQPETQMPRESPVPSAPLPPPRGTFTTDGPVAPQLGGGQTPTSSSPAEPDDQSPTRPDPFDLFPQGDNHE